MGKRYLQRKPSGSHNGEPKFLSCGSKKNILSSFIERKGRKRPNRRKRERERERERERNHLYSPPPLVFVPIANNMQPRWVRTHNCFFFFNLFWLLIPLVWREKLCFVIWLGFVFCSDCDFVVHWEKAEILYAMLNFFFYSSCLILLVEEKEMKKMREC